MRTQPIPRLALAVSICVCFAAPAGAQNDALPPSDAVQPQLYATGFAAADCLVVDGAGTLYAANYREIGAIGRITAQGKASIWRTLAQLAPAEGRAPRAAGMKIDGEGRLIVADIGGGRLLRIATDGAEAQVLADRSDQGRFTSPHGIALDLAGNIYMTDQGDLEGETPTGSVCRYNITTQVTEVLADGLMRPAGLAVSPDEKHLVVAEGPRNRLLVFDFNEEKELENRRVLIEFPGEDAGPFRGGAFSPAGMVFDARGRLYVCMRGGGVINVVDIAAGKLLRQYQAGGEDPVDCHFYERRLYTSVKSHEAVFRLPLNVPGFVYNTQP